MSLLQYIKDTRGELRHVAWPTQMQTIIYTVIVIGLSLVVAAYLGFFDFIFTTGLSRIIEFLPEQAPSVIIDSSATSTGDITVETFPIQDGGSTE